MTGNLCKVKVICKLIPNQDCSNLSIEQSNLYWFFTFLRAKISSTTRIALERALRYDLLNKKGAEDSRSPTPSLIQFVSQTNYPYIMPPMPPMPGSPAGIGFSSSGISVISAAVVRIIAAIELAFSTALRVTLTGSERPAANMST